MTDAPGIADRLAQLLVAARGGGGLGGGAALVFAALLLHSDTRDGVARPSVDALAEITGLHRRNVQRALDALLGCGAIESTEADSRRRSSGGRGRVTRWVVAPHAIRGDAATLCRRERVADAPRIGDENSGDAATVSSGKGGAEGPKGWRERAETVAPAPPEHSEHYDHSPPTPPRGAGVRSATSETTPVLADGDEPRVEVERRMQASIEGVARVRNPWALRGAVIAFLREGGTEAELAELIALGDDGERSAADRVGLVMHWISHVGVWRGVLADHDLAGREQVRRRHALSATSPAAARDLLHMPARAEGT